MTYNIRLECQADADRGWSWTQRRRRIVALIRSQSPDVFGLQEVLPQQLDYLESELNDFAWFGVGRDDATRSGEHVPVFYRRDRFDLVDAGTFWLSTTPDRPGNLSWNTLYPRIATWTRLLDRRSRREFVFLCTHFDYQSDLARRQSTLLLKRKLAAIAEDRPAVVAGDFNCLPGDPARRGLVDGNDLVLSDVLGDGPQPPTYRDFDVSMIRSREPARAIDSLFLTAHWHLHRATVDETHDGSAYPSDHVPVLADVSLPA